MSPKERAEQIVREFYTWGIRKEGQSLSWAECKELAKISVNNLLYHSTDLYAYFLEVRNEIDEI